MLSKPPRRITRVLEAAFPGEGLARVWLCLGLLAGGVVLRLWDIYDIGIVDDDMAYYVIFGDYYRKLLFTLYPPYFGLDIAYKPAFLLLSLISVCTFGFSEYALPMLNAFLSVGVGLTTHRVARLVSKEAWVPTLALAAVTFTPFLVQLDQKGLSHTGAALLLLFSIRGFLLWARFPWVGQPRTLRLSALCLGIAFLFHPTVLLYCLTLGLMVVAQAMRQRAIPFATRMKIVARFVGWALLPLLLVDVIYRLIFAFQPMMLGGRPSSPIGRGYLGDVINGFLMAGRSGEGTRDPAFAWKALTLFQPAPYGWIAAGLVVWGTFLLLRSLRDTPRSSFFLAVAYGPLLLMAWNSYVGQFSRALHATLPTLTILAAVGLADALRRIKLTPSRAAAARTTAAVLIAVAGGGLSLHAHVTRYHSPSYSRVEISLPRFILGDLKDAGIDKVYIYYSGFYGLHWFFYLQKYFSALPFILQNAGLHPAPDYRMLTTPSEMITKVKTGQAEVVIMRRMPDDIAKLWDGRKKEEDFLRAAELLGGRRLLGLGHLTPYPEQVYVYDFRHPNASAPKDGS